MSRQMPSVWIGAIVLAATAYCQDDAFQVNYAVNLNHGDAIFNISNAGTQTAGGASTNICANVYAFTPDEFLLACCSCVVTPNALVSLSARKDLLPNTLSLNVPTSLVLNLVASAGTPCNAASVTPASLAPGMLAWGTTVHALPTTPVSYGITESPFARKGLSAAELARITGFCGFLQANGSGYGICRSCHPGGQGAVKQ